MWASITILGKGSGPREAACPFGVLLVEDGLYKLDPKDIFAFHTQSCKRRPKLNKKCFPYAELVGLAQSAGLNLRYTPVSTACPLQAVRHRPGQEPGTRGFRSPFAEVSLTILTKLVSFVLTCIPDRNTTLPHPDADTSPNACISQDDISVTRVMSRHRRSFLAKHKRITSHGIITPDMQMYNETNVSLVMSECESSSGLTSTRLATVPAASAVVHSSRPHSKGDGESLASVSTGDHNDAAPKSPTDRHNPFRRRLSSDTNESKANRRRSLIQKLGIHRHHE